LDGTAQLDRVDVPQPCALSDVVIVVPCYNEAARLSLSAFEQLAARDPSVRFVFVDDASTDGTCALLAQLSTLSPRRFELLELSQNVGQGEAVRKGVARALASGARYVGYWDADLATPLDEIERFARVLDGDPSCLVVMGSRKPHPSNRVQRHPLRFALGRAFAWTAAALLRMGIYDTQCGANA